MGWVAIFKDGTLLREEDGKARPVDAGNNGELVVIAQEDFGRKIAVDLLNGVIAFDYKSLGIQNGTIELDQPGFIFAICEETNVVGEYKHLKQEFVWDRDEEGKRILENGKYKKVRNDILTDLVWRPIWFTRTTSNGITADVSVKIVGAQTTTPKGQGERNIKKLITLFPGGSIGID